MEEKTVFLELEDVRTLAKNEILASDIWELEFLFETGIARIEDENVQKTVYHFLLYSGNPKAIANLLVHFSIKQLPTSLLEFLLYDFPKRTFPLVDQIGRLCSMDRKHPHYPRFVKLLKEVLIWKHRQNYLYSRNRETWRLNHFETILELIVDYGIDIWYFGHQFTEEELGILRLLATDAELANAILIKSRRLAYRIEEHTYGENLQNLMKMRKSELVNLCKKYRMKGYSKLRSIQIIYRLLKTVPSKENNEKEKMWKVYWIEDHDFMSNLNNLKKMKLGIVRAIGYKYRISGAFYMKKSQLIRELLRVGKSTDQSTENLKWQDFWLEENYPEVNLYSLSELKKKDLVKIAYKYGLKRASTLRKSEIIEKILECDPRTTSISDVESNDIPVWWVSMNKRF